MKHVRLPLTSREFLMTHVDSENLVRENTECKELLLEAMRYHLMPEQRSSLTTIRTTSRYVPRDSVQGVKSLGGHFACLYREK